MTRSEPATLDYGEGLPLQRRRLVVTTVAITTVLSVLDGTISNVALPTIAQDLRVSSADVVWVVNAFQVVTSMLIVPLAAYADIAGFARTYRSGVGLFLVASVLCALARTLPELVAARALQGIGAAAILATSQPITRFAFPRAQLGLAIGIQSLVVSVSSAAGPSIGGAILAIGSWPWLFWINVPLGTAALALSGVLPAMPRTSHRFDWTSAILSGVTLALFITGLDQLRAPMHVASCLLELTLAVVLGTIAVRRQERMELPLIAVDLVRIRIIGLSLLAAFVGFMAENTALIALPFYFHALGYPPAMTGFLMTPFPVGSALIAIVAGRLSDRYQPAALGSIGLAIMAAAIASLAALPAAPAIADVVWRMALGGVGFGLFTSPNLRAMVGAAPVHRSGAITGLTTSSRMIGSTTGVAFAAVLFSSGGSVVAEPTLRMALWVAAALTLAAIAVSSLRIVKRPVVGLP